MVEIRENHKKIRIWLLDPVSKNQDKTLIFERGLFYAYCTMRIAMHEAGNIGYIIIYSYLSFFSLLTSLNE